MRPRWTSRSGACLCEAEWESERSGVIFFIFLFTTIIFPCLPWDEFFAVFSVLDFVRTSVVCSLFSNYFFGTRIPFSLVSSVALFCPLAAFGPFSGFSANLIFIPSSWSVFRGGGFRKSRCIPSLSAPRRRYSLPDAYVTDEGKIDAGKRDAVLTKRCVLTCFDFFSCCI
jgi:hypothetical protein